MSNFSKLATFLALLAAFVGSSAQGAAAAARPNILWLSSEDHGPHLGCYGDSYAHTPHVDRLAERGIIYTHAWSCAPVCAPARSTLIAGMYACSTGAQHMRSMVPYPAGKQMYPQLLRAAGYYCTNNDKEDYNLTQPGQVWDESSGKAHWRKRPADAPFFAVFNCGLSHEGRIRRHTGKTVHDPASVRMRAYHPETPETRHDWAAYYDGISDADAVAGQHLQELADAGLADDTIVFYFADHGSGMPRNKRTACNSGLHVPLVVYVPEKFRELLTPDAEPGGRCDRLVSFVDFAPTVLSLAGVKPPEWMQGHAFLGQHAAGRQELAFGFRGRMDERIDLVRSATDGRYVYVRNYLPHRPAGQHVAYMFETPTTQVWRQLHEAGKLNAAQDAFWQPRACEELYDLTSDPDEVHNLAASPDHQQVLARLRDGQQQWARQILDVGFLPEADMHARSAGESPYDMARDDDRYPFERVFAAAELASRVSEGDIEQVLQRLDDPDAAVQYWGAVGVLIRGEPAVEAAHSRLIGLLDRAQGSASGGESCSSSVVAAEALRRFGSDDDRKLADAAIVRLADWRQHDVFTVIAALNCVDPWDARDRALAARLIDLPKTGPLSHRRYASYVPRLLDTLRSMTTSP
ncbi:MAG: sulfatase [Pirellulales bacterium]